MNNFDLTKYLAEGKLLKEEFTANGYTIRKVEPEELEVEGGFSTLIFDDAVNINDVNSVKEAIQDSIYQTFSSYIDETVTPEIKEEFADEKSTIDSELERGVITDEEAAVSYEELQKYEKDFPSDNKYLVEVDMNRERFSIENHLTGAVYLSGAFGLVKRKKN